MNKRGTALIVTFMVIVVLTTFSLVIFVRSMSERSIAQRYIESTQAFWLAEAGVSQALDELRTNPNLSVGDNLLSPAPTLGLGRYNFDLLDKSGSSGVQTYTVRARGCIPADCNCVPPPNNCRVTRIVQAVMNQYQNIPPGFYDNAIYSAGNVSIGSNCIVNGNVFSGGTVTGPVNGDPPTQNDPTLHNSGLPALTFAELRQKSIDQGWYDPDTGTTTYPTSFYNVAPTPPDDPGIPNVVFVNGNFTLVGGGQVVKGFIVVGGDMIYNAEIGGNATVDGCIYTRGNIVLSGGGGPSRINVNGGVWAGGTVTMTGNEQIDFNQTYMNAIRDGLDPNTDVQIRDWRDAQNPYTLAP
jgi:hypothetical protein